MLKPCPYEKIYPHKHLGNYVRPLGLAAGNFCVECLKCGFRTPRFDTEEEAIQAWNTRPTDGAAEAVALRVAVKKAKKYLDDVCSDDFAGGLALEIVEKALSNPSASVQRIEKVMEKARDVEKEIKRMEYLDSHGIWDRYNEETKEWDGPVTRDTEEVLALSKAIKDAG